MDSIKKETLEMAEIIAKAATAIEEITAAATVAAAEVVSTAALLSAQNIKATVEKTGQEVAAVSIVVAQDVAKINAKMGEDVTRINSLVVERMSVLVESLAAANQKYKKAERAIKRLAFYDVVTKLPNRRKVFEHMKDSIKLHRREGKTFAVLMLDLDKFKMVNDTLGHAAGDDLLKQVAVRITSRLRESDMVARLGGDEFVIILEDCSSPLAAEKVADEVIVDLAKPFELSGNNVVQIGASIGISFYPSHGITPTKLINAADSALYHCKNNGRGCFHIANQPTPQQRPQSVKN